MASMRRKIFYALALFSLLIGLPIQAMAAYSFTWTDTFTSGINPTWWITSTDSSSSIVVSGGQVIMTQGSDLNNSWDNYLKTKFSITGDFMMTIDYSLTSWPVAYNSERVGLGSRFGSVAGTVERINDSIFSYPGGYLVDWGPGYLYGQSGTSEMTGTLKIERIGDSVIFSKCQGTTCTTISTQTATGNLDYAQFGIWKFNTSSEGVVVAFDNFTLNANYDPRAVPIPAAVWFLGSGLIGLIGFRRMRK